jgi:hypothetical protein
MKNTPCVALCNGNTLDRSTGKASLYDSVWRIRMDFKSFNEIEGLLGTASKYKIENTSKPFNIILSSSDLYYRENFHSDLIQAILDQGSFLSMFIDWLNTFDELRDKEIDKNNYNDNSSIKREESRIDILIENKKSMHCIIVENKINNAGDMDRQLPKYIEEIIRNKFTIDAVVYLSMDGSKRPDKRSWTKNDHTLIANNKVIYASVYNKITNNDMVNGFLKRCVDTNHSEEESSFLRQYIDLLLYLGRTQMDTNLMDQFYNKIQEDNNNYQSALNLRSMLGDLSTYRRDRLYNYFLNRHQPFDSIGKWSSYDTLFMGITKYSKEIKLDMLCNDDNYTKLIFWIEKPKIEHDLIYELINRIGYENEFKKESDNKYSKSFKFPEQERDLDKFIDQLLEKMRNICN